MLQGYAACTNDVYMKSNLGVLVYKLFKDKAQINCHDTKNQFLLNLDSESYLSVENSGR